MTTATTKPGGRTLAAQARTAAMIAEIEYLLGCGEGEHAITRPSGSNPTHWNAACTGRAGLT